MDEDDEEGIGSGKCHEECIVVRRWVLDRSDRLFFASGIAE